MSKEEKRSLYDSGTSRVACLAGESRNFFSRGAFFHFSIPFSHLPDEDVVRLRARIQPQALRRGATGEDARGERRSGVCRGIRSLRRRRRFRRRRERAHRGGPVSEEGAGPRRERGAHNFFLER